MSKILELKHLHQVSKYVAQQRAALQFLYKRFTKCNIVHWIVRKNPAFRNYPYLMMNQKLALYDVEKMFRMSKDIPLTIDYYPKSKERRQECLV